MKENYIFCCVQASVSSDSEQSVLCLDPPATVQLSDMHSDMNPDDKSKYENALERKPQVYLCLNHARVTRC